MKAFLVIIILGLGVSVISLFSKQEDQGKMINDLAVSFLEKQSAERALLQDDVRQKLEQVQIAVRAEHARMTSAVEAQTRTVASTQQAVATIKEDLAKSVQSGLTKDVINAASEQLIKTSTADKALIKDPAFLEAVAKVLVANFQQQLRGNAGADADNEVVAKMLAADERFLDAVSVTLLLNNATSKTKENDTQ